jgi:hypothetical protein
MEVGFLLKGFRKIPLGPSFSPSSSFSFSFSDFSGDFEDEDENENEEATVLAYFSDRL